MTLLQKEQQKAAILAAKLTDEEIDYLYDNPGVAKYFRAFAEGKVVLSEYNSGKIHKVKYLSSFDCPQVYESYWSILQEVKDNE